MLKLEVPSNPRHWFCEPPGALQGTEIAMCAEAAAAQANPNFKS